MSDRFYRSHEDEQEKASAQAEITRLRSLNAELVKALRPFAQYVGMFETRPDECPVSMHVIRDGKFTAGDLRNAAALLARAGETA